MVPDGYKVKLLTVLSIFEQKTDKENPMSADNIAKEVTKRLRIPCSRKGIYLQERVKKGKAYKNGRTAIFVLSLEEEYSFGREMEKSRLQEGSGKCPAVCERV